MRMHLFQLRDTVPLWRQYHARMLAWPCCIYVCLSTLIQVAYLFLADRFVTDSVVVLFSVHYAPLRLTCALCLTSAMCRCFIYVKNVIYLGAQQYLSSCNQILGRILSNSMLVEEEDARFVTME